jgi:hypothetical protein
LGILKVAFLRRLAGFLWGLVEVSAVSACGRDSSLSIVSDMAHLLLGHAQVLRVQGLYFTVRCADHQLSPLAVHRYRALPDPADQVDRTPRLLVQGEQQLVFRVLRLELFADRILGSEKPVRRHQAADPLVRAVVVIVGDEVRQALARFFQVLRLYAAPEFFLHRLPETLALAHGLRVVAACYDVADALLDKQLLKAAFSPPCEVLASLVGQHLLGLAEALDTR